MTNIKRKGEKNMAKMLKRIAPVGIGLLLIILIAVTILILIIAKTGKKTNRMEGIICVAAYIIYTVYIIMR
jgi:Ca2+/Na+ antiporter